VEATYVRILGMVLHRFLDSIGLVL